MDILKTIFPHAFKANEKNAFITTLIIYALIFIVSSVLIFVLAKLPIVNIFAGILGTCLDLYTIGGIVLSVLVFLKKIK